MCDRVVGRWSSPPARRALAMSVGSFSVVGAIAEGEESSGIRLRHYRVGNGFGAQIKCVTAALGFARLEFEGLEVATCDIAHDLGEINDGPPNAPGREGCQPTKVVKDVFWASRSGGRIAFA